jgi:hypothetical protein
MQFKLPSGGRSETTYAPTGYAAAYLESQSLDKSLREEREDQRKEAADQLAEEKDARAEARLQLAEQRAQFQQQLDIEKFKHQQFMDQIQAQNAMLKMKDDQRKAAMDLQVAQTLDRVKDLPVHSPMYQKELQKLNADTAAGQVLVGDYRRAVADAIKERTREYIDYFKPIIQDAKNVGYTGGVENLPVNDVGELDREKVYGTGGVFEKSYNDLTKRMEAQGMYPQTDEAGKVVFKAKEPVVTEEQMFEAARRLDPTGENLGVAGVTAKGVPIIRAGGAEMKVVPMKEVKPQMYSKEKQAGVETSGMVGGTAFIPSSTEPAPVAQSKPSPAKKAISMEAFLRSRQEAQQPAPTETPTAAEPVDESAQ